MQKIIGCFRPVRHLSLGFGDHRPDGVIVEIMFLDRNLEQPPATVIKLALLGVDHVEVGPVRALLDDFDALHVVSDQIKFADGPDTVLLLVVHGQVQRVARGEVISLFLSLDELVGPVAGPGRHGFLESRDQQAEKQPRQHDRDGQPHQTDPTGAHCGQLIVLG